ncbi:hypothetical protein C0J52_20660 [Blattella germanica]|nr:hypothetical protein C0J52_20660 [Blattella germanica]
MSCLEAGQKSLLTFEAQEICILKKLCTSRISNYDDRLLYSLISVKQNDIRFSTIIFLPHSHCSFGMKYYFTENVNSKEKNPTSVHL